MVYLNEQKVATLQQAAYLADEFASHINQCSLNAIDLLLVLHCNPQLMQKCSVNNGVLMPRWVSQPGGGDLFHDNDVGSTAPLKQPADRPLPKREVMTIVGHGQICDVQEPE